MNILAVSNPCNPNPCLNNGECVQTSKSTASCKCRPRYTGYLCETLNTVSLLSSNSDHSSTSSSDGGKLFFKQNNLFSNNNNNYNNNTSGKQPVQSESVHEQRRVQFDLADDGLVQVPARVHRVLVRD